jgi:DNA-binding transcriptional ArsR family regulator
MEVITVGVIGPDRDSLDVLRKGLREFPCERVVLVTDSDNRKRADKAKLALEAVGLRVAVYKVAGFSFEHLFHTVSELKASGSGQRLVVNVDADYRSSCIMLSASFVNGVQAIGILDGKVIAYPIMKFSYYSAISERKQKILEAIAKRGEVESLEEISQLCGLSLPLVTYHVRGSGEKPGLEELGLVETKKRGKQVAVKLTALGKLLLAGQVEQCPNCPTVRKGKK